MNNSEPESMAETGNSYSTTTGEFDDRILTVSSSDAEPTSSSAPSATVGAPAADARSEPEVELAKAEPMNIAADVDDGKEEEGGTNSCICKICSYLSSFYQKNSFMINVVCAIPLAYAYPPLGAVYLAPKITSTWIAVIIIFLLSGLGLRTEEFSKAFKQIWFNLYVQFFNFFVVSSIVFGVSRGLHSLGVLSIALADGMVIGACLPMTINMVIVLTKSSGGDEASAVLNSTFGNVVGVFLSPVMIFMYLGVEAGVDVTTVFFKLAMRVLLPIAIGQLLQKFVHPVVSFVKKYKPRFKKIQELCLTFIVYTVFCRTFTSSSSSEDVNEVKGTDVCLMLVLQLVLLTLSMVVAWTSLSLPSWFGCCSFLALPPELRVMGLYGCTHKTVAMGIPLINAVFEADPRVGLYTLPLLVWHPMQLVIGSALAPRLANFVANERARLDTVAAAGGRSVRTEAEITVDASVDLEARGR